MIERLIVMGYLVTDNLQDDSQWQGQCASRRARWLKSEYYVTLGIQLDPPNDRLWSIQASLLLAACEDGWECSLEHNNQKWVLWRYYPDDLDDQELASSFKMQLAIGRYLEQEMLKPTFLDKPRIWGRKL